MRCALAGLLILLLAAVAGAEAPPPVGARPTPPASELERSLALLERIDSQTLPADQRQALYLGLADALLGDAQPERALGFLAQAHQSAPPDAVAGVDEQIRKRLQGIATPVLAAVLQAGTPLATLLQGELARRGSGQEAGRTIGVLLPLSGRHAPFGEEVRQGLELARAAGEATARTHFVYRDTAVAGASAAALVRELAAQPGVLGIIGPLTAGEAAPAAHQAEQARIPLLLLAAREGTTGGFVFRNALTVAAQVRTLADYARDQGVQRFIIFHPASRHGELSAGLFQAAVEGQGGQVLAQQGYPPDTLDLREHLQTLATAVSRSGGSAEALFLPDDARQVAQIIPQLAFSRLDYLQLLGTSGWHDPELGRMAGPLSEGAVFVDGFFAGSPWPEVRDFVARHQVAYGELPSILAAQGYDAARIILTLLARPEARDRETLRQALATLRDFPGVTGQTRFGPNGDAEKTLFLLQVQDGAVVQIN